eukprot:365942-Chlamydomonas_euryale.AAC.11
MHLALGQVIDQGWLATTPLVRLNTGLRKQHTIALVHVRRRLGHPALLIHCPGLNACRRYQFRALADAGFHVFALDLVGFGLSEKASIEYSNGKPWVAQIAEFIQLVIKPDNPHFPLVAENCTDLDLSLPLNQYNAQVIHLNPPPRPASTKYDFTSLFNVQGNSLGGFASLAAAADHPDLVGAVALLNGAGPTKDPNNPPPETLPEPSPFQPLIDAIKRVVCGTER